MQTQTAPAPVPSALEFEARHVLLTLLRALVDFPDELRVEVVGGSSSTIYEVSCRPVDIKRLIGKRGRTADAVRELLVNLSSKHQRKYILEILEPPRIDVVDGIVDAATVPVKVTQVPPDQVRR